MESREKLPALDASDLLWVADKGISEV